MTVETPTKAQELADIRAGGLTLAGFVRFAALLRTEDGKPLEVHGFQRLLLGAYFRGVIELVVILPKKNGKTTLFAALALFHLWVVAEAEVVIAAASGDQATILYRQAVKMIQRSELEDTFRAQEGYRRIKANGGQIRVLPGDPKTADGVIPTLAIVDELHRHKSPELYAVLRDGLTARDGQMVTISTAGWDLESPLGKIRKAARALPTLEVAGTLKTATAEGFAYYEWSLEDGDDLMDLELVKSANPAPWHTLAKLKAKLESPSMTAASWSRFYCGVWTHGEEPWLSAEAWDSMRADVGLLEPGTRTHAAMVYGHGAAVVLAALREDGKVAVRAQVLSDPETSLSDLERAVSSLAETNPVELLAHDTALIRSAELLEVRGIPTAEFPLRPQRMAMATATLRRLIDARELIHDGDPMLRQHVLAGATKDSEAGYRIVRTPGTNGLVALAVAVHLVTEAAPDVPQVFAI